MPSRDTMGKLLRGAEPINNLGNASPAPNTMAMRFGNAVSPLMRSAQSIFPASNPYGQSLIKLLLGNAPQSAQRMAEGYTNELGNFRGSNPLNYTLNQNAVDMAGALPVGAAVKALGGIAGVRESILAAIKLDLPGAKMRFRYGENPTPEEIESLIGDTYKIAESAASKRYGLQPHDLTDKQLMNHGAGALRAIESEGNTYLWPSEAALHEHVSQALRLPKTQSRGVVYED